MCEMSTGSESSYDKVSPYGFIKYQVPMQQMGDLVILNTTHGVLVVGMVIKLSGQVAHTNHVCGPELLCRIQCLTLGSACQLEKPIMACQGGMYASPRC